MIPTKGKRGTGQACFVFIDDRELEHRVPCHNEIPLQDGGENGRNIVQNKHRPDQSQRLQSTEANDGTDRWKAECHARATMLKGPHLFSGDFGPS